jgi:hypothetical protein
MTSGRRTPLIAAFPEMLFPFPAPALIPLQDKRAKIAGLIGLKIKT